MIQIYNCNLGLKFPNNQILRMPGTKINYPKVDMKQDSDLVIYLVNQHLLSTYYVSVGVKIKDIVLAFRRGRTICEQIRAIRYWNFSHRLMLIGTEGMNRGLLGSVWKGFIHEEKLG